MKHFILLFSALIALSNNVLAQNCTLPPELQNGLVGYWPFCGNANDESGNGNDGLVNGATLTEDRLGNSESAYRFEDFTNISCAISNDFTANDFTVSMWVNFDGYNSGNNYPTILLGENYYLMLQFTDTTIPETLRTFFGSNEQGVYDGLAGAAHTIGTWMHVTILNNDGINTLYFNGEPVAQAESASIYQGSTLGNSILFGGGYQLPQENFNGSLDDIGIWNRALTAEEIAQLYGNFNPVVSGCTSTTACNYSALATTDDGSCTFAGDACDDGNAATTNDILSADCGCAGTPLELGIPHTCGTDFVHNPNLTYGSMTDQEGNVYKTIVIGDQEWMAENLNTSIYRNGEQIATNLTNTEWEGTSTTEIGAWGYYNNEEILSCPNGKLYNWYACVDPRELCPSGWRVPSSGDWSALLNYIDPTSNPSDFVESIFAGTALKSTGTIESGTGLWYEDAGDVATNSSGFSATPGGQRHIFGDYNSLGNYGFWWSSTGYANGVAAYINLLYYTSEVYSGIYDKPYGFSVRCVRDANTGLIPGCTDPTACNYNALATTDDGSCTFAGDACDDGNAATTNDILSADCGCAGTVVNCATLEGTLQEGLVGYWPFCGNANDESGNGNDGLVNGATLTEDRFGNVNGAFDFNHSNIITPLQGMSGNNPRTISFWYNFSEDNTGVNSWFMVGYGGTTPFAGSDFVATSWPNSNNDVGIDANTSVAVYDNNSGVSAWHHFVAAYDPSFGESISDVKIYVDGILQSSPNVLFGEENIINTLNDYSLRFGQNYDMMDYIGKLDDIGIWNRALTAEEITSLYTGEPVVQPACAQLDPALQEGLVGYWPFCGNANDESGNGNDGVVNGATLTEDRFGNAGSAYAFANSIELDTADIKIPVTNVLMQNNFTLSTWSKLNSWTSTYPVIAEGDNGTFELGYAQSVIPPVTYFYYEEFLQSGDSYGDVNAPSDWSQWQNTVVVNNNQRTYLYINGQLVSTSDSLIIPPAQQVSEFIRLGRGYVSDLNAFNGLIDDVGFWNRALTAEEITALYTGEPVVQPACAQLEPALQNGLVGYWPFCGNANDESGNGNDGVVSNAALTEDRFGNATAAYNFNGVNAQIQMDNVELDSGDFTISGWLNSSESNSFDYFNTILAFGGAGGEESMGLELVNVDGLENQLRFTFREFIAQDYNAVSPTELTYNQWIFFTLIREGNQQKLFMNGNLVAVTENVTTNDVTQTGTLYLGAFPNSYNYTGLMDDIGIWNRALTAEEIALLYGNYNPQVTGCIDPLAFNYNPEATINEGCQYTATIFVYNDLNGNGEHEADEPGLSNWPVLGNDINGLVWTNANGNVFLPLAAGQYEFTALNPTDNWISTTPTSSIASLGSSCTDQNGILIQCPLSLSTAAFGLQVIPGEAIVAVGPYQGFADIIHCTDGYESGVYLENIGSQTVSGFMTLSCDPLFTPGADSYFTTPPIETGPGYALWNIEDFLPGEYELLTFHIAGPGVEYLNQSFTFDFDLTLLDPQGNMIYNDGWSVTPIVACAYDPNDLTGYPEDLTAPHEEGYTVEHFIHDDHVVEFRVRFQNTGTLPAEDIDIYIPIDPNVWELNSIEPLMRVADMQTICLHDDGSVDLSILEHELPEGVEAIDLLIFSFDDIFLPDSASDPDGSQGYVWFQMKAKDGLDPATELNAQAFIYFEQNPPIATNETYHVIFDCTSFTPMTGDAELCADEDLLFSASQPYVDEYAWSINGLEGSNNIFIYEGIEAGDYTLQLNTSNVLCPLGEDHEVNITVHELPELGLPLDEIVCEGEEFVYEAESNGTVSWSNGANTGDTFAADQSFTVTATAIGVGNCSTSDDWSVTVNPLPSALVDIAGNVLSAQEGTSWQWSINGVEDATTQSITAAVDGNYQVVVTNEFGCAAESDVIVIDITNSVVDHTWLTLALYPNPMKDLARLELPKGVFNIALYDMTGACVRAMQNQQGVAIIERESLASGVYQVRITQGGHSTSVRLVIE